MWISSSFTIAFMYQVCALTAVHTEHRKFIYAAMFDSVLLSGDLKEMKAGMKIQWNFYDRIHRTLILFHESGVVPALSSYYQHRCTYYPANGSLELRRLEVLDSGVYHLSIEGYYPGLSTKPYIYFVYLDVEEFLSTPLIVQDPTYIASHVQLSCIVRNGRPLQILWQKENKPITNSSLYTLASDNSTLSIRNVAKVHCGFYTCTVLNDISQRNISHFLYVHGRF
ncbi:HEPACAM family member 2-like [Cetorhinus maximus]